MKIRLFVLLAALLIAPLSFAGLSLKPGPQLWVYSTQGNIESITSLVKSNPFDKEVLGRAMFHTLRRGKGISTGDTLTILKLLMSHGAEVNYKTLNGQTPLIAAVTGNNAEAVKLLLENGADAGLVDSRDKRALDYALGAKNQEIAAILNNPPPPNPVLMVKPDLEPKVLNLDFSTEGTAVYMTFDLVAPGSICVKIIGSLDKGATYNMRFEGARGDIGKNVQPGNRKRIVWNTLVDYPNGIADLDVTLDVVTEKCR